MSRNVLYTWIVHLDKLRNDNKTYHFFAAVSNRDSVREFNASRVLSFKVNVWAFLVETNADRLQFSFEKLSLKFAAYQFLSHLCCEKRI